MFNKVVIIEPINVFPVHLEKLQDVAKMLTDIDKNMNVLIQCSRQQQEQKNIKKKVLN